MFGKGLENFPVIPQRFLVLAELELEVGLGPIQFRQGLAGFDGGADLPQGQFRLALHVEGQRLRKGWRLHRALFALRIQGVVPRKRIYQFVIDEP